MAVVGDKARAWEAPEAVMGTGTQATAVGDRARVWERSEEVMGTGTGTGTGTET